MDQSLIIKNVDEIGEETESRSYPVHDDGCVDCRRVRFTPSTSNNQDYHITQSDNQAWVELAAIPLSLPPELNKTPGIILADGKHYASHRSMFPISPHHLHHIFLRKQSPSASPPYHKKGVTFRVTCNFQKESKVSNSLLANNLYIVNTDT